jgi:hypothetical protein
MSKIPTAPRTDSTDRFVTFIKDLHASLVSTRNLEINLFWQRANYFLVLNSALALGVFNLKDSRFSIVFACLGIIASALWFWVCLGGKYWQTRWEQRLWDFEREFLPGLDFFGADPDRLRRDVCKGLNFHRPWGLKRWIYAAVLRTKPSVSFSMILLAALFFVGWITLTVMLSLGL